MIREFTNAWFINKDKLQQHFEKIVKSDTGFAYADLVKMLFDIVINPSLDSTDTAYDTDHIYTIDDGDYQGTLIFILHKDVYQPDITEYVYTNVGYGSCSYCDTLMGINDCDDVVMKINDYMTLCLHLLQNCVPMKEHEKEDEL